MTFPALQADRWYVDYDDYSCPFYPPYFAGVVYAMTFPALQAVYNYSRAFDPFFCDDVLLGILGRLSGVHFRPLPQHVYSPFCDLVYKSHAAFLNSTNFAACHEAEKPADQIFLWNKLCHWPVAEYPKDIALLNE
uniref:Hexosyltransferase n=1 Tax=Romanomermis culicivorax TaxID=13658 RepID=A0A915HLL7_ROMCU